MDQRVDLVDMTAEIVTAYVSANQVPSEDLPRLIQTVYAALESMLAPTGAAQNPIAQEPAVPAKRSVTPEYIVCLEDGKKFKSLKRHLRTRYGMSPEEYRAKWGLPHDYPMVAPNYAKARSALAKRMGLGTSRRGD